MFWRVAERNGVKCMFTAPTAIRAIRREDPAGALLAASRPATLERLYLAGERADSDTISWASRLLGIPVIDHWWQTETGWPAAGTCAALAGEPPAPGSAGRPVPGYRIRVLDCGSAPVAPGRHGEIAIELPLPPGCLTTLWGNDAGFRSSYLSRHPGYYSTGDVGFMDENGCLHVMGRSDDIINVAGHRLATGAMEEIIGNHPEIAECAVVGAADAIRGQVPLAFVVRCADARTAPARLAQELQTAIRDAIGPIAMLREVLVVPRLPKTRSGKILRRTLRTIADGEAYDTPASVEDPAALAEVAAVVRHYRGVPEPLPR
jgi:propionyl-CoA synthetase